MPTSASLQANLMCADSQFGVSFIILAALFSLPPSLSPLAAFWARVQESRAAGRGAVFPSDRFSPYLVWVCVYGCVCVCACVCVRVCVRAGMMLPRSCERSQPTNQPAIWLSPSRGRLLSLSRASALTHTHTRTHWALGEQLTHTHAHTHTDGAGVCETGRAPFMDRVLATTKRKGVWSETVSLSR